MIQLDAVRKALTGPLASIRTPFNRDGSVDYNGVRRMVDFGIAAGSRTSLLTAGDSHFLCLTDEEVSELTRVVAEHTAGRAMVCAADWEYCTPQAVEFAQYGSKIGVDIYMVHPPDWSNGCTPESLVGHYAAVAEHLPVMVVTNIFPARGEAFGLQVIEMIRDRVPNVLAVKDDLGGDFARQLCLRTHAKWAVFAGGGLRNHLNMHPYGCDGFMDRHMNFKPEISKKYWAAIQANDLASAAAITRDIELPLEKFMGGFPGGRDAAIHGLLEIYGIAGRWRRKPYHSLTDAEMSRLRDFMKSLQLL